MLRHSLDIIPNLQDGGRLCSKAVILNDFQALLLKFKAKLHQISDSYFWNPVPINYCLR